MRRMKTMGRWCCLALALAGVVASGCQTPRGLTSAPPTVGPFAQQPTGPARWGEEAGAVLPCRH